MLVNSARISILAALLLGHALAHSQAPTKDNNDPRTFAYDIRSFGRAAGNVGAWWSFLNENEKSAFLDGFQVAMQHSLSQTEILCKVIKDGVKTSSDQQAFNSQIAVAISICMQGNDFAGFEKVTVKGLNDFYSVAVNYSIPVEWALGYLRDKESGKKTEGELLDALRAEQKMHGLR